MFYFYTISGLGLSQETIWVNIKFERRDLTSVQKSHPSLEFSGEMFAFNLIKQNVTHFSFIFLTLNFFVLLKNLNLNYYCQVPWVSPYCIMVAYQTKVSRQCLPLTASASSPPWYSVPLNSHIQNEVNPGCIGIEMLFSLQIFFISMLVCC